MGLWLQHSHLNKIIFYKTNAQLPPIWTLLARFYFHIWSILHKFCLRVFIQFYLLMEAFGFEALYIASCGPSAITGDSNERNVFRIVISFLSLFVINVLWHIHQQIIKYLHTVQRDKKTCFIDFGWWLQAIYNLTHNRAFSIHNSENYIIFIPNGFTVGLHLFEEL